MEKPYWEKTYRDLTISTFSTRPDRNLAEYAHIIPVPSTVLDVGCGEGRNSIFLAKMGHIVDAFDISEAGNWKSKIIAASQNVAINFWVQSLENFQFEKEYDVILSQGVLHLPEKEKRDIFIEKIKENTKIGGLNFIGIFTNRLPATPDNAPFTKSLFDVGELPEKYYDWEIIHHLEGTFTDSHPDDIIHEHAFERIIARKK